MEEVDILKHIGYFVKRLTPNHIPFEAGRDLWRSSGPVSLFKQDHLRLQMGDLIHSSDGLLLPQPTAPWFLTCIEYDNGTSTYAPKGRLGKMWAYCQMEMPTAPLVTMDMEKAKLFSVFFTLAFTGHHNNHTVCLRVLSKCFLNSDRLVPVTTPLGSQIQCSTTLWRLFPKKENYGKDNPILSKTLDQDKDCIKASEQDSRYQDSLGNQRNTTYLSVETTVIEWMGLTRRLTSTGQEEEPEAKAAAESEKKNKQKKGEEGEIEPEEETEAEEGEGKREGGEGEEQQQQHWKRLPWEAVDDPFLDVLRSEEETDANEEEAEKQKLKHQKKTKNKKKKEKENKKPKKQLQEKNQKKEKKKQKNKKNIKNKTDMEQKRSRSRKKAEKAEAAEDSELQMWTLYVDSLCSCAKRELFCSPLWFVYFDCKFIRAWAFSYLATVCTNII
ncbi:hypothetical protein BTVI_133374 [Pitangus sulphuratus]|nr:hypothetical protein BTVI_133374 [Pitangus sulphuratus]